MNMSIYVWITLYSTTSRDSSHERLVYVSISHKLHVGEKLFLRISPDERHGQFCRIARKGWIIENPILWFWSKTCGKLVRNALNTADDLEKFKFLNDVSRNKDSLNYDMYSMVFLTSIMIMFIIFGNVINLHVYFIIINVIFLQVRVATRKSQV